MNSRINIAVSIFFLLAAVIVLVLVVVKQDFSTYGLVLIGSAVLLIVLFGLNIRWALCNGKDAEKAGQDKINKNKTE